MSWREAIRKVADGSDEKNSLVDLGIKLANAHGNGSTNNDTLTKAKPSLAGIEATLGLISHEAASAFLSGKS
jgi:hypothetical protein